MVNEEYAPTFYDDGISYPDGNIYYPNNGQQVMGINNYVSPSASFVQVLGSENVVGNDSRFVSIVNSSGINVQGGLQNVSVINSSGVTITESNVSYVRNLKFNEANIYQTIKVTLTAAQLATGYTVPIQVIAAPGAGKIIDPISCFAHLRFNSVAYDVPYLYLNQVANTALLGCGWNGIGAGASFLQSAADAFTKFAGVPDDTAYNYTNLYGSITENTALYAQIGNGLDPTTGDSEIDLYITYRIVTLT